MSPQPTRAAGTPRSPSTRSCNSNSSRMPRQRFQQTDSPPISFSLTSIVCWASLPRSRRDYVLFCGAVFDDLLDQTHLVGLARRASVQGANHWRHEPKRVPILKRHPQTRRRRAPRRGLPIVRHSGATDGGCTTTGAALSTPSTSLTPVAGPREARPRRTIATIAEAFPRHRAASNTYVIRGIGSTRVPGREQGQ